MSFKTFKAWLNKIQQEAELKRHRVFVMIVGDDDWITSLVTSLRKTDSIFADENHCLVYSDHDGILGNVNQQNFRHQLGNESQGIIFSDSQLTIDALAALSGTLVAGGVFLMAISETNFLNQQNNSRFFNRFINMISVYFNHHIIKQKECEQALIRQSEIKLANENRKELSSFSSRPLKKEAIELGCVSNEQYHAVKAISKVLTGHRNRPLILTADRGRGKTCALALACAQLIENAKQPLTIIITAPHIKALDNFFRQLKHCFPLSSTKDNKLSIEDSTIVFYPVDQIIKHNPKASLLMVDEAAAIPVYLLKNCLMNYHRTVFSTTVHGYEGAGRGFTVKFEDIVSTQYPNWQKYHISEPIRWADNDSLEAFIFDVCLLNASLPTLVSGNNEQKKVAIHLVQYAQSNTEKSDFSFREITQDELLNESLLVQVFAVLVTAHYQTSPSDLKLLLEHPRINIICAFYQGQVLAVSLLMREGHCSANELASIKNATRRIKDQFLPQSLLVHCGIEDSFEYSYLRVMRIAVHPSYQHIGIGKELLKEIELFADRQNIDFVGASFGGNKSLLNFWLSSGYQLARMGFTKDASSGEHSALVIKNKSRRTKLLYESIIENFYRSFTYLLPDEYQNLPDKLIYLILVFQPEKTRPDLTSQDKKNVIAFANKERLFSSCAHSLHIWIQQQCNLNKAQPMIHQESLLLIARLLKRHSIETVVKDYQLTGKKLLNELLVLYVKNRLENEPEGKLSDHKI